MKEKKRKVKTTHFGVNFTSSLVIHVMGQLTGITECLSHDHLSHGSHGEDSDPLATEGQVSAGHATIGHVDGS